MVATSGVVTAVGLFYPDELIEWTTGDGDGGVGGLGGDPADVGLIGDNGANSFFLPASNTSDIVNIETTSNVFRAGLWGFRIDTPFILFPCMLFFVCLFVCLFLCSLLFELQCPKKKFVWLAQHQHQLILLLHFTASSPVNQGDDSSGSGSGDTDDGERPVR